jgi:ribose transport system permease protein
VSRPWWLTILERYGLVLLFAGVLIFFSSYSRSSDHYLSLANVQNVLGNQCIIVTLAVAAVFPLVCGRFDLSVGANAGLCSVASAAIMSNHHQRLIWGALGALALGLLVGCINGALVAYLKLSSIIVTLAATTIISGIVLAYANGQIINLDISQTLTNFGSRNWGGMPRISLLAWYVLLHTAFGRYINMAGRNPEAARLVGINVDTLTFVSFAACGAIAGLAGLLMTARSGGANPQSGPDLLFPALTAVFLGATAIRPGEFNIVGTVVAALFLAAAVSGMNIAGVPPYVEPLFDGIALLVAVTIYVAARRSSSSGAALSM